MERLSQAVKTALTLEIEPTRGANTYNGTAVDTRGYDAVALQVFTGDLSTSATLDVKIQESEDGSTNWADISGAAIVQMTQAGGDSNKIALVDVRMGGRANRRRYVRAVAVVAVANAVFGAHFLLYAAEKRPTVNTPASVAV